MISKQKDKNDKKTIRDKYFFSEILSNEIKSFKLLNIFYCIYKRFRNEVNIHFFNFVINWYRKGL